MATKYLEVKSFNEIDIEAFSLIGASTKRDKEGFIGLYGSGNKYSISSLIRNGIDFKVFSGEDEIVFTTREQSFRDQTFKIICINGKETSLTTDMGGKDWDNPFAPIREIYSNALDEDKDATIKQTEDFVPEKGYTKFYIEMTEEVKHFYKNVHLYFCDKNPKVVFSNSEGSILSNTDRTVRIFRKGILAHQDDKKAAVFHYNLPNVEINESRVVKSQSTVQVNLAYLLKSITNTDVIEQLIYSLQKNNNTHVEHSVYWECSRGFSKEWEEVCRDKKLAPLEYTEIFDDKDLKNALLLPVDLLKALKADFPELNILGLTSSNGKDFTEVQPSKILVDKVLDALDLLNNTRYSYRLNKPQIKYVRFMDENTLGLAENNNIYLASKLDVEDVPMIAKIIIEENEHNITGYSDKSRQFQNHLFSLYFDELQQEKISITI